MSNAAKIEAQIAANIRAHDRIAKNYEQAHGEIYNAIEQARLRSALKEAMAFIDTRSASKVALDFGCGAGNLTKHISDIGCNVVASDVSKSCLDLVLSRDYSTKIDAVILNGIDLSNLEDSSFDMVATYSVLHHVPDYLGILKEFLRVLKPGGVIFIDHELTDEYWRQSPEHLRFLREVAPAADQQWRKYLRPANYLDWFVRKFIDPKYRPEGDIHVFPDDHIEWARISDELIRHGAEIVKEEQYLLFRRGYDMDVYSRYVGKTSDMQFLVARKIG